MDTRTHSSWPILVFSRSYCYSTIGYWHHQFIMSSVCQSVGLSLCVVSLRVGVQG